MVKIVSFLVAAVAMTSSTAMAAYVCPAKSGTTTKPTTTATTTAPTNTVAPPTTTSTTVPTTTSNPSNPAPAYGQCGGVNWTGPTTCVSGYHCVNYGEYYSQCVPN